MSEHTIKEIKVQKNKKNGTIEVTLQVKPYKIDSLPKEDSAWKKYRTRDVVELVRSAGHRPGSALQEAQVCTYRQEHLSGTWIFQDLDAKPAKTQTTSRTTRSKQQK